MSEFWPSAEYIARNTRASRGLVAHDWCRGPSVGLPGCISCGCTEEGPCISHKSPKVPPRPAMDSYHEEYRLAKALVRIGASDVSGSFIMARDLMRELRDE